MRRLLLSFMVVLLVIGYSTAGEKPILLDVNIGYTGVGSKDNPTKVGEYDSMKSYPSGEVTGTLNVGALDGSFGVYYYTKDEKNYFGDFNLGRVINVRYDFNSMIHRLQHDMMEKDSYYPYFTFPTISGITGTNIKGWTAANPVFQWNGTNVTVPGIQSLILEDLASTSPNKNMIYRSKQSLNVDLTLPFFSYVKPYFAFEQEVRRGWHQTYVMVGKCAPCHTVATTSRIDDTTRDITIGAKINYSIASLNYSHTWRTFDNGRDGMPSLSYDKYTGGISYNFSDRLIYGNNTTYTIYYDERPDIERSTDKLVLKLDLPYYTTGIFQGYWDTTRNNYIDKEYTSNVYALRFVNKAIEGLTLSLTGRYYRLNNDDAKVRIGDLAVTSLSGVYASYGDPAIALNGLPGIPGYPGVFNYTRKSIVDRDVYEVKLDFSYRLTPKYNLTGGYEYKRIERDNSVWKDYWAQPCYTDLTGETVCLDDERFLKDDTTQVHKVKLALSGRPINNLNFRVSYMYQYIDDPLTSKSVGLEYDRLGPYYPYVFFYNLERRGYGTNIAKDTHEAKVYASWNPIANLVASLDLAYRYEKNGDVENDYRLDRYYAGLNLVYMPFEKLTLSVGSMYDYSRTKQKLFVDAYRACAGSTFGSQAVGGVGDKVDYDVYNWVTYASIDYAILDNLRVFFDVNYTYSKAEGDSPNYPVPGEYPLTSSYLLWPDVNYTGGNTSTYGPPDSPLYLMTFDPTHLAGLSGWTKLHYNILEASLGFDWKILKNLGLKVTGTYRYVNDKANYLGEDLDGREYAVSAYLTYQF